MKVSRREISDLETALTNYQTLWSRWKHEADSNENAIYVEANIKRMNVLIKRIKEENRT